MLNQRSQVGPVFQALADPTRRGLVERLSSGPASVSELAEPLPMSLSAVVQHLGVLEAGGIVTTKKVGRVRTCQLDPDALDVAGSWIAGQQAAWQHRLDRLGAFLTETEPASPPGDR